MRHLILSLSCIPVFIFLISACSSTGNTNTNINWGTPPGSITAIGDAGSPNEFTFKQWRLTKAEIPNDNIEALQIEVQINTNSLTTEWKDLEKSIRTKRDYFNVAKFPLATVSINGAKAMGDGKYTCDALLTLKGISKNVPLTFSISDTAPYQVKGEGTIFRSKFNFNGGGPKEEVPVSFDLVLP